MAWSDKEIWEKIKEGDKWSFEVLFRRYQGSLCLFSYNISKNDKAAEEIVNDVFFKIWDKRGQIQITSGIKPYLFRSVFNASIDYLEQNRAKNLNSFVEIDKEIRQISGIDEDYIFNYLENEKVEKDVMAAIEQLPEQCKVVFCLSRFDLLTYHEISERLNISVNTVKTQISRALESLRKQLEEYL
jgi:RNA polymerase sigma-70 factor (ECF subfamily)